MTKWTKKALRDTALFLIESRADMSTSTIKDRLGGFYTSVISHYGSYVEFLEEIGVEPYSHIYANNSKSGINKLCRELYEDVVEETLNELGWEFRRRPGDIDSTIRPDFVFTGDREGKWIQAHYHKETNENDDARYDYYCKYCNQLTLLYLKGDGEREKVNDKIRKVSVYDLLGKIDGEKNERLKKRLRFINGIYTLNTERGTN